MRIRTLSSKASCLVLFVFYLQSVSSASQSCATPAWIGNWFSAPSSTSSSSSSSPENIRNNENIITSCNPRQVRIRTTRPDEINSIAEILSHASVSNNNNNNSNNINFRVQIDRLFAKKDIESLLKRRNQVIQTGKKLVKRIKQEYYSNNDNNNGDAALSFPYSTVTADNNNSDNTYLKILWNGGGALSEQFKSLLEQAAHETAEPNIWQHHVPFALTPAHLWWFQHVQLTATAAVQTTTTASFSSNNIKQQSDSVHVIGFCEVAMLANPMYSSNNKNINNDNKNINRQKNAVVNGQGRQEGQGDFTNGVGNQGAATTNGDKPNLINGNQNLTTLVSSQYQNEHYGSEDGDTISAAARLVMTNTLLEQEYVPAILNLATAHSWRRQGIANRLVRTAERYVRQYWKNETLIGLFVETNNHAAQALYEKLGYQRVMICDGGNQLGDMWYMVRPLEKEKKGGPEKMVTQAAENVEQESIVDNFVESEQTLLQQER